MTEAQAVAGFWRSAAADPERIAVVTADGTAIAASDLLRSSRALAAHLWEQGLTDGDSVAVVLPNVAEFLVAYLAAVESGWYLVPVNSHLEPPEIAHVVGDCDAAAVIAHRSLIAGVPDDAPGLAGRAERRVVVGPGAPVAGFTEMADVVAGGSGSLEPDPARRRPGAVMMYTSGTTGRPKGVRRPRPEGDPDVVCSVAAEVYCRGFGVPLGPEPHLVCGPLYHAGPFASATSSLHVGNTLVLMDGWSAESCLELIERHRVASLQVVPTMLHRLLSLPAPTRLAADVSSVRSVMHTGAPCPVHVKQACMEWLGPVVYETYGGTESIATIATPRRWLQKPGTVGRPIHGVRVRILDEDGEECPPGESGKVYVEHPGTADTEYFKDPQKTAAMHRGGMVTLGDIGYVDEDGFLFLCDRAADLIISGGVNIYPAEVESVLLESDLVADVAVIGVPDDEWGERVEAVVELERGVSPSDDVVGELLGHCEGRLARFKRPRRIHFVDELPRTASGKVQRHVVRNRRRDMARGVR